MTRFHLSRRQGAVVLLAGVLFAATVAGQSTASLSGIVVSADASPQPIRQAIVTIAGSGLVQSRSVVTDDAGRFSFEGLPAGRFTASATKPAYVANAWGARRPGRAGTPITLTAGQRVSDIRIVLPRGAVITGTVRDGSGEPAEGLEVAAVPASAIGGARLRPEKVLTDDRGVYRIFGLAPDEYVVYAAMRFALASDVSVTSAAEIDNAFRQLKQGAGRGDPIAPVRPVTFAPVFYPRAVRVDEAGRVAVGIGEERGGVDITLDLVPTARVEGTVVSAGGALPPGVSISLDAEAPTTDFGIGVLMGATVGADGRFNFRGVTPGAYAVIAQSRGRGGPGAASPPALWGRARVDVRGEDITGVTVTLRPMLRVTGQVRFDAATSKPPPVPPPYSVQLRADLGVVPEGAIVGTHTSAPVAKDGSFTISSLTPGRYTIDVPLTSGSGWVVRSAMLGDRDLADTGVEIADADLTGVVITMTDRRTELSGALSDAGGAPATDYAVVALPSDRGLWRPGSRRIKIARPGTDGRFVLRDLPAGEYVLSATGDIDIEELRDMALLERIAAQAVKVTLAEGERKSQDLRIVR